MIEIDGNDGTGKSTLVRLLAELGVAAQDQGRMTQATDDPTVGPEEGVKLGCDKGARKAMFNMFILNLFAHRV